jgi:hypothetical protein
MEEKVQNICLEIINEYFKETENIIDFNKNKFEIQKQRAEVSNEFEIKTADKCVEIINENYDNKNDTINIVNFVKSEIQQKKIKILGF